MIKKTFIFSFFAILIFCFVFGLVNRANASDLTGDLTSGVTSGVGGMDGVVKAAPTASPVAGTYHATQSVTLSASGSSAICYTTDGTTPACASATACTTGTVYSSAISVTSTATIKSIACYADASAGPANSGDTYTLTCSTASVSNGSVSAYPACAITCDSSYTLSGSSCVYSGGGGGGGGGGSISSAPTNISIIISNGAIETNNQTVNLSLFAFNAERMMISNDANFVGASWEDYANSKTWWLPAGIGTKTVYAKFKSSTGLVSDVASDTINLTVIGAETPPAVLVSPTAPAPAAVTPAAPAVTAPAITAVPSTGVSAVITRSLALGIRGEDVRKLQQILNSDSDTRVADSGDGSPGNETDFFGLLTKAAVQKFQIKYGIVSSGDENSTGFGMVGPKTRAKLAEISAAAQPSVAAAQPSVAPVTMTETERQLKIKEIEAKLTQLMAELVRMLQEQIQGL